MSTIMYAVNLLELYLKDARITWIEAMNQLQGAGVVSDLCVGPADVAPPDCETAVKFLKVEGEAMMI